MVKRSKKTQENLTEYLVNVEVGEGYTLLLKNTADLDSHIQSELQYLNDLNLDYSISNPNTLQQLGQDIANSFSQLRSYCNQLGPYESRNDFSGWKSMAEKDQQCKNLRDALLGELKRLYDGLSPNGIGLPCKSSQDRDRLEQALKLSQLADLKKGIFEGYLFNNSNQFPITGQTGHRNRDIGRVFGRSLRLRLNEYKQDTNLFNQVQQTQVDLTNLLNEAEASIYERINKLEELEGRNEQFHMSSIQEFQDLLTKQKQELQDHLKQASIELDHFKQQVQKALSLKGPIAYWEDKAVTHQNRANTALGGLYFIGIAFIGLVCFAATTLSDKFNKVSEINVLHSALLVMTITLFLWGTKTILRTYLSNTHLMNDAEERLAMTKSYLALQESDHPLNNNTIAPMLAAMFRPAGDGIVKDEAPTFAILDLLGKGAKNT